jgi:hypothetical protein
VRCDRAPRQVSQEPLGRTTRAVALYPRSVSTSKTGREDQPLYSPTFREVVFSEVAGNLGYQKRSCTSWRPSLGMKRLLS